MKRASASRGPSGRAGDKEKPTKKPKKKSKKERESEQGPPKPKRPVGRPRLNRTPEEKKRMRREKRLAQKNQIERARLYPYVSLKGVRVHDIVDGPQSRLGRYLARNWERVSLVEGESLVYWLRKLVFRGAWLDHQVKRGALEVVWEEREAEFAYQHPGGGRPLLELAPIPSWHELQYRG